MKKTIPKIQCPTCFGIGKVYLSGVLLETMIAAEAIHSKRKKITSATMFKQLKGVVSVTAICNRLDDLNSINLLRREKVGKWFIYTPTK